MKLLVRSFALEMNTDLLNHKIIYRSVFGL